MVELRNNAKKYYLLSVLLLTGITSCFAQTDTTTQQTSVTTLKKIIVGVESGFEWEQKISRTSTLSFFGGIGVGFASSEVSFAAFQTKIIAGPSGYVAFKKYYNLHQRVRIGRSITNNAGNFLFAHAEIYLPVENQNYTNLLFSLGWGMQRPVSKRLNIELQVGITQHVLYDNPQKGPYSRFHPFTNVLSISYLL